MKSRTMADLLIGEARFDKARVPTNIETAVIAILAGESPEETYPALISSIEEGACIAKAMEAVSVVSSIIGAIGVMCPRQVLIKPDEYKDPPFFIILEEKRNAIDREAKNTERRAQSVVKRDNFHWGAFVGMLHLVRYIDWYLDVKNGYVTAKELHKAVQETVVPYILVLWMQNDLVSEMPKEILARTSEIVLEFAQKEVGGLRLLVKGIKAKRKVNSTSLSPFGKQMWKELRFRFWQSCNEEAQEEMIPD